MTPYHLSKRIFIRMLLVGAVVIAPVMLSIGNVDSGVAYAADETQAGIVNTEDARLNIRTGPGSTYAIVAKLDPGVVVEVVGSSEDGQWVQLETADGEVSGWAAREFVTVDSSNEMTAVADPSQAPAFGPRFIPAAISGRLSSARGSDDGAISEAVDTQFESLGAEASDESADEDTDSGLPGGDTNAEAIQSANSSTELGEDLAANLSEDGAAIASVTDNSEFTFPVPTPTPGIIESDSAAQVAADAEPVPAATSTPRPIPDVPTAITQPDRMNVRSGPGTNYGILTSVPAGTEAEILALGPRGEWYRVQLADQEEPVWLFAGMVDAVGPMESIQRVAEEDVPPAPEPAQTVQPVASSAAVAAPPPAGGGFFGYGIQAHLLGGQVGSAMTSISNLGFDWVKQQVEWKNYQPQPGAVGMGELGGIVSAAQGRGINVLFSVVNAPTWAREPGYDGSVGGPPADPQTYANFVGAMAGQFCGTSLKAIEIWNEQNLHYEWGNKPLDPAEYMNLLRPAYAAIKAACPEMLVISGALTPAASNGTLAMDDFAYLEGMYQNGLAQYSDGIGAHPSGYNVPASVAWEDACAAIQQTGNTFNGACDTPHHSWAFRSTMEGYRNIMIVYGDANKRIWPTEFGWAAGGAFDPRYAYANDNGFDEQAAWTVEAYQMMKNWGWVGPAFLWNLNFRVVADGTEKAQWGIVGNDWQPLPTYQALQAMPK